MERKTITRKDFTELFVQRMGCSRSQATKYLEEFFEEIIQALAGSDRVEIRNFGVWEVRERKARRAMNPRTGEEIQTEQKWIVSFTPGKRMKELVSTRHSEISRTNELKMPDMKE